jgi:hypothetical protein
MKALMKEKAKSKTPKMPETEGKKISKFAQYLKTEYRKGTITNMRAVLK